MKSKRKSRKEGNPFKGRICMKCNRPVDDEDKQCPACGVDVWTYSLHTKQDWQQRPKRFPRIRPNPWKTGPDHLTLPGDYPAPPIKTVQGGQIESKRRKH